jgi:hypothetical protein
VTVRADHEQVRVAGGVEQRFGRRVFDGDRRDVHAHGVADDLVDDSRDELLRVVVGLRGQCEQVDRRRRHRIGHRHYHLVGVKGDHLGAAGSRILDRPEQRAPGGVRPIDPDHDLFHGAMGGTAARATRRCRS